MKIQGGSNQEPVLDPNTIYLNAEHAQMIRTCKPALDVFIRGYRRCLQARNSGYQEDDWRKQQGKLELLTEIENLLKNS